MIPCVDSNLKDIIVRKTIFCLWLAIWRRSYDKERPSFPSYDSILRIPVFWQLTKNHQAKFGNREGQLFPDI